MGNAPIIPLRPDRPPSSSAPGGDAGVPLAQRTDDELMRLSRAGDRRAFGALARRHMGRVKNFCIKMVGDPETGGELCQDVWVRVWSARDRYQPGGKFESYLFLVARNLCRNARRDRARRDRVLTPSAIDAQAAEPSGGTLSPEHIDALLAREESERVTRAVSALPVKLREAIVLRFAVGLDYQEIATIVGRGESTVRSRVHHGLKKLRGRLEGPS